MLKKLTFIVGGVLLAGAVHAQDILNKKSGNVHMLNKGEVHIRAKDPHYAWPGPDEAQKEFQYKS